MNRKTSITPWVLDRFGWFLIWNVALHWPYNASHTFVLVRRLLPKAFLSWISRNQKNKRKWNEKPPQLHEFKSDWDDFWIVCKRSIGSTNDPIHSSWSDDCFPQRWSVEYLKINKKAKMKWKTATTSWVQVRSGWFLICDVALDSRYNSSHTMVLVRYLLPRCMWCVDPV